MKTVKQVAEGLGCHPRTIKRRIEKLNGELVKLNNGVPFSFGFQDELPEAVSDYLLSNASITEAPASKNEPKVVPPVERKEVKVFHVHPKPKQDVPVDDLIFKNKGLIILFAAILIGVDALSFAWIAVNTYPSFGVIAAIVFAFAGMAVGYSAVKNILSYKGWNGDGWAWGFGLFQLSLHLCAMEVLGDWSFFLGKIVISVGLPLATAGLATALKMDK